MSITDNILRERDQLRARLAEVERERDEARAVADVRGGAWCEKNRAEGRGPCGVCAWCCKQAVDRAERAEAEVERLRIQMEGQEQLERLNEDGYEREIARLRAEVERLRAGCR